MIAVRKLIRIITRDFERSAATPHITGPAFDDVNELLRSLPRKKARAAAEWAAVYGEAHHYG